MTRTPSSHFLAVLCGAVVLWQGAASEPPSRPVDSDHLYDPRQIWTIQLKIAPDQWETMEPKGGGNPFGGGPSGVRTLAPVLLSQGDLNRDGRISPEESTALAQK